MTLFNKFFPHLLIACFFSVFGAGILMFPDAPYRQCGSQFCGKHGKIHTEAEYRAFRIWEPALFISLGIGAIGAVVLKTRKKKVAKTASHE